VCGSDITLKNITIENNSARLGQAVALHTEGDRLRFIGCRFLGHQDTVYTGRGGTRLLFRDCYIEGTTDFIFGPSTAWFENCTIKSKANSYITAASTPADVEYGYVFNRCRLIADEGVTKVYLGRPWRPYAYTLFMNCTLGSHIVPAGWENWRNPDNEKTARYAEYNNSGDGANTKQRVAWSRQLTKKEVEKIPQFFGL
jgi:pectin methylesterase-like acyl-CoA thioesterase